MKLNILEIFRLTTLPNRCPRHNRHWTLGLDPIRSPLNIEPDTYDDIVSEIEEGFDEAE